MIKLSFGRSDRFMGGFVHELVCISDLRDLENNLLLSGLDPLRER